jgi:hypothetical protein
LLLTSSMRVVVQFRPPTPQSRVPHGVRSVERKDLQNSFRQETHPDKCLRKPQTIDVRIFFGMATPMS